MSYCLMESERLELDIDPKGIAGMEAHQASCRGLQRHLPFCCHIVTCGALSGLPSEPNIVFKTTTQIHVVCGELGNA